MSNDEDKERRLAALAQQRRSEVPAGYFCVSRFHDRKYDCDFVSPWTKSAHNVNAELMIVAQDWASEEFLNKPFDPKLAKLGYGEHLETNCGLFGLLEAHVGLEFGETYATNVFPFIKPKNMSASIRRPLLIDAARKYAVPQIEIVNPLMVICLGISTFDAIRAALSDRPERAARQLTWAEYERAPSQIKSGRTEIHAVTHLGAKGKIGRGKKVGPEWTFVAERLSKLRKG
jgi:restriction system protein